jgi:hypothetical protein
MRLAREMLPQSLLPKRQAQVDGALDEVALASAGTSPVIAE